MIKLLTTSGFLLFSLFNIFLQADVSGSGSLASGDTLQWKPNYRLQLEDFEGVPDKSSGHAAITATGINYYIVYHTDNSISIRTECIFNKKESWINKDLVAEYNYTLKHEQGHFDIAEVYARRMQAAMNKFLLDKTNKDVDLQNVYDELTTEQRAMQQLYDKETQHATNARKQYEWNKKIRAMLSERDID